MPLIPDLVIGLTLHSLIACVSVEGVIRALAVRAPATRIALRDLALVLPVVFVPVATWLAPWRTSDEFLAQALFVSQRFDRLVVGDLPFRQSAWWVCAAIGALFLARDVRLRLHRNHADAGKDLPDDDARVSLIGGLVRQLSDRMGVAPPVVRIVDSAKPLMHLEGVRRRHLLFSTATLAHLTEAQLEAAIAHELSHLASRDLRRSIVLVSVRLVLIASPLAHIIARRQHQELEWRADDTAAHVTGRPIALARALVASGKAASGDYLGLLGQGRLEALERRCHRLANDEHALAEPHYLPLSLTAVGLLVTMCLVS